MHEMSIECAKSRFLVGLYVVVEAGDNIFVEYDFALAKLGEQC
jgi:hypothetical protein